MPGNSRATLPQEFYDKTSDSLLIQPQPQFLYAKMFLGALMASLNTDVVMGLTGREAPSAGAGYSSFSSDQLQLASDLPSALVGAAIDFKGAPGNTVRINRPAYATGTPTEATRRIASGASISTSAIASKSEQSTLTLFRYGGPYDGAAVAPLAIESFDASMGVHSQPAIVGNSLKQDFNKFVDAVVGSLLDLGSSAIYPKGMSAANDATSADEYKFSFDMLTRLHEGASKENLPTLPDGNRCAVLHPTQFRQLSNDGRYQTAGAFYPEFNVLFGGSYKKTVAGLHIFESTTLTSAANTSGVTVYTGHVIAPGALLAGMGRAPRVASSTDDNYGETVKVVWLADLAFGLADNRFCIKAVSA